MPKIAINLLGYNQEHHEIAECMDAILKQTFQDFILVFSDNGSKNQLVEFVQEKYGSHPKVRVVDNAANLGYAPGHNKFFAESDTELVMPINPDAILEPEFLENIISAFNDPKIAGATGKMLRPYSDSDGNRILDGTGIVVSKSRRGKERGQLEPDKGQYDNSPWIFGISGSAAVYRKAALEEVKINDEYFDTDFFMYWEDLDLSWRLRLMGWEMVYVPKARVQHERAAGQSEGGYKKVGKFIKHHKNLPDKIKKWNWRNHLFTIIKNDFGWAFWKALPYILVREVAMLGFIVVFETKTLTVIPEFFRLLPRILKKRNIIQARKKVESSEVQKWFQ